MVHLATIWYSSFPINVVEVYVNLYMLFLCICSMPPPWDLSMGTPGGGVYHVYASCFLMIWFTPIFMYDKLLSPMVNMFCQPSICKKFLLLSFILVFFLFIYYYFDARAACYRKSATIWCSVCSFLCVLLFFFLQHFVTGLDWGSVGIFI